MAKVSAAFEKVFGGVNGAASIRDGKKVMRVGKTARDKANGHNPSRKNIRIWDASSNGKGGKSGEWIKAR